MQRLSARLYLLFSPKLCRTEPDAALRRAIAGGVELVQWRAPADDAAVERALHICRDAGVPLIVNDDPELAVRIGADGAHVGQTDMPAQRAREILGPDRWLGVSTHGAEQIHAAEAAGADHVGLGPCFPTTTKGYTEGLPRDEIGAALTATELPVFAIGGITQNNLPELRALGVTRIAVSAAILGSPEPEAAARALAELLPATA